MGGMSGPIKIKMNNKLIKNFWRGGLKFFPIAEIFEILEAVVQKVEHKHPYP